MFPLLNTDEMLRSLERRCFALLDNRFLSIPAIAVIACASVLAFGVPYAGGRMENWPLWLAAIWVTSFLALPFASFIGVALCLKPFFKGQRTAKNAISLLICMPGVVLAIVLFATFTGIL